MNRFRIDVIDVLQQIARRSSAAQRLIPLIAILSFVSYVGITLSGALASQETVVYGISVQKFTDSAQHTNRDLTLVEKCVFFPLQKDIYRNKALAKQTVSDLQNLSNYAVFDARGNRLNTRFEKFEYLIDDFPNYYAGSPKPNAGCGNILVAAEVNRERVTQPDDLESFEQILSSVEKQLYVSSLKQLPTWVSNETKRNLSKHDLAKTFKKSNKSAIEAFYDGQSWYLTRSYFVEFVTPTTLSALILYKVDRATKSLYPSLAYVSTQGGEGIRFLNYAGFWDLDTDGRNEIIVHQFGFEWQGFSYLRWTGDRWQLGA